MVKLSSSDSALSYLWGLNVVSVGFCQRLHIGLELSDILVYYSTTRGGLRIPGGLTRLQTLLALLRLRERLLVLALTLNIARSHWSAACHVIWQCCALIGGAVIMCPGCCGGREEGGRGGETNDSGCKDCKDTVMTGCPPLGWAPASHRSEKLRWIKNKYD